GFETSGPGSSWTDHHQEWRSMSHPDAHARAQHVAYPSREMHGRREAAEAGPHVIVLFGATGDLARRKLLSGIGFLAVSGFTAGIRVVGTSLEELTDRSEEHTSELQSRFDLVCRLLLDTKKLKTK